MIRVIIVDDNIQNLYLLEKLLTGYGYLVSSARNGRDALKIAKEKPPDIILSDILMPVMDGFELCRQWKADNKLKQIPFIFYTATYTEPQDEKFALNLGADRFIIKPQIPDMLKQQVDEVLEEKKKKPLSIKSSQQDDMELNRQYNKVLFRKLEKKLIQLEKEITEHKKTEAALRETQEQYELLFNSSIDAILLTSTDGRIFSANPAACRMFGRTEEELLSAGRSGVIDISDPHLGPALAKRTQTGEFHGELTLLRKDGSKFQGEITSVVFRNKKDQERTSMIIRDITGRKLMEEKAKHLAEIVHSSEDAIISKTPDGIITSWNRGAEKIYGYSEKEMIGKSIEILSVPGREEEIRQILDKIKSGEVIEHYEAVRRKKNGREIYMSLTVSPIRDSEGKITAVSTIGRDITERKTAEKALTASEEKFRLIIEQSSEGISLTDENCIIIEWNSKMAKLSGIPRRKALGRPLWELLVNIISPERRTHGYLEKIKNTLSEALSTGLSPMFNSPTEVVMKQNGKTLYIQQTLFPIKTSKGYRLASFYRNITKQKLTEEELKQYQEHLEDLVKERTKELSRSEAGLRLAKEQAERANKAKTVFLSSMSHEIRTPLNAVLGFSQLLLRDATLSPQQNEWLLTINHSGEHLLALINDILEISRIESGRVTLSPDIFDLRAFIDELAKMFRNRLETKNVKLKIEQDKNLPRYIEVDGNKIRQIFINVIGNAVKFTEEGEITIHIFTKRIDSQLRLAAEISDTGPGISSEDMKKVFETFSQTALSISKGGTGLGLSISRQFARLMGGDITVKSRLGKGSTFYIELNIKRISKLVLKKPGKGKEVAGIEKGQKTFRILVADDEPANRRLIMELLLKTGFKAEEAANGQEVIVSCRNSPPDLIFLDISMPVMNGYEVIRKLKTMEKDRHVPIIAVTASAFDENKKATLKVGADGYIRKPYKLKEIFDALQAFLGVKYIYKEEKARERNETQKFNDKDLLKMPESLVKNMVSAAQRVDLDQLLELIDKADKIIPSAGPSLRTMAKNFQYDDLIRLLKKGRKL